MFKIGDCIRQKIGGCRHRVFHIIDDDRGFRYKVLRIEGGTGWIEISDLKADGWEVVEPPPGETKYTVGQVVLSKFGNPIAGSHPAIITKVIPGVAPEFNQYSLVHVTLNGEYNRSDTIYEKDLEKDYILKRDLHWLTTNGSPTGIIRSYIEKKAQELEAQAKALRELLERMHHL